MLRIPRVFRFWLGLAAGAILATALPAISARAQAPTNGLIMLIEFERIEGIRHWEQEFDHRGLTALIQVQSDILGKYRDDFARLAAKGYTIAGNYSEKPFWDMPYDEQLARMREAKAAVKRITHKPMRVFGSRYFAYDENTLRAADAYDQQNCTASIGTTSRRWSCRGVRAARQFHQEPLRRSFQGRQLSGGHQSLPEEVLSVTGDLVLTGKTRGSFTCVSYQSSRATSRVGDRLAAERR